MSTLDTNEVRKSVMNMCYDEEKDIWQKYILFPERILWDRADQQTKDGHYFYIDYQQIARYYHRYKHGVAYEPEGFYEKRNTQNEEGETVEISEIAYKPARVRIKEIAKLINKQARFMFGAAPDIQLDIDMDDGTNDNSVETALNVTQEMMDNVLRKNKFYAELIKAFKDCCIGKRVACVLNFNKSAGVTIEFLSAFHFTYSYDPMAPGELAKFEFHKVLPEGMGDDEPIFVKKKYWLAYDKAKYDPAVDERYCHIQEIIYNVNGEDITKEYENKYGARFNGRTDLKFIPAEVIINTGLLDQKLGISDVSELECNESWYNYLSGLNVDALKKNMNPMKYTVDMDTHTTGGVTNRLGGYVDLQSDRKNPESKAPDIGLLESSMNFVDPLNKMLERFEQQMHDAVDVPNINLETMASTITSGKALRAIYWGLIQRCDEKMTTWQPALENIITKLLDGLFVYPDIAKLYLSGETMPMKTDYEVTVIRNNPIPEDEEEEKQIDMQEVAADLMSRQAYMIKWHEMTDVQANKELIQIAVEKGLLDNMSIPEIEASANMLVKMIEDNFSGNEIDLSPDNEEETENINLLDAEVQI